MLRAVRRCVAVLSCCTALSSAHADEVLERGVPNAVNVREWDADEGLPEGIVNATALASDGSLWLGTFGGLARFDGLSFQVFDFASSPSIPSNRITALTAGPDGRLCCGAENGLVFQFGDPPLARLTPDPSGASIQCLAYEADGRVLAGTMHGVWRTDVHATAPDKAIVPVSPTSALSIVIDKQGAIWAAGYTNVQRIEPGGEVRAVDRPGGGAWLGAAVGQGDRGGRVYAADSRGLTAFVGDQALAVGYGPNVRAEPSAVWVGEVCSDQVAVVLSTCVLMVDGVQKWINGTDRPRVRVLLDDPRMKIVAAAVDQHGQLWIGTSGDGLKRLSFGPVQRLDLPVEAENLSVRAALAHRDGSLWFALGDGVIVREDGGEPAMALRPGNRYTGALLADADGSVLLGQGDWIVRMHGSQWEEFPQKGVSGIHDLLFDQRHDLWIAGINGLWKTDGALGPPTRQELPGGRQERIRVLAQDAGGVIWAGADERLYRVNGPHPRAFFDNDDERTGQLRSIICRPDGEVWAGTYGSGVFVIGADDAMRQIKAADGLPENVVINMLVDEGRDALWMLGNQGAYRFRLSQWRTYLKGQAEFPRYCAFRSQDGMREGGGGSPAGSLLPDGSVVFCTTSGPRRIMPRCDDEPVIGAPHVAALRIDGVSVALDGAAPIQVPVNHHRVEIEVATENLSSPETTWYECRLAGFDDAWRRLGPDRGVSYTQLPKGSFAFEMRAARGDGPWTEAKTPLRLERPAAWHETIAVRAGAVISALGLLSAGLILTWRRHRRRLEAMEEKVRMQANAHDRERRLLAELNHRVRNNLATVLSLIQVSEGSGQSAASRAAAPRIHAMARVHTILSRRSWSLVHLTEIINDVVRTEHPNRPSVLEVRGSDLEINPEKCQAIALVLHELAVNARRHGAWATETGSVNIEIGRSEGGRLVIDWAERIDRPLEAPARPGTGLSLVTGFVNHDLRGTIRTNFEPPGFRATIEIPLGRPDSTGEPDSRPSAGRAMEYAP